MTDILIYGATGYTGELVAARAVAAGLRPLLAGRSADKLRPLAKKLGLEWVAVPLDDAARLRAILADTKVVLHIAGPFSATSAPMVDACLATGTHYIDITGEIAVLEAAAARDAEAKAANVMLLPGAGYDVVPSDCLAAHIAARLPGAARLRLSIGGFAGVSHGTAKTMVEAMAQGTLVRRGGRIVELAPTPRGRADFGKGPRATVALSWGDVATAWHSTGIPDIEVYFEAPAALGIATALLPRVRRLVGSRLAQRVMKAQIETFFPRGPSAEARARGRSTFIAEAVHADGRRVASRLVTPEPYHLTMLTAVEIARRAATGGALPGYQTPATAFGADFILGIEGVTREDL